MRERSFTATGGGAGKPAQTCAHRKSYGIPQAYVRRFVFHGRSWVGRWTVIWTLIRIPSAYKVVGWVPLQPRSAFRPRRVLAWSELLLLSVSEQVFP